MTEETLDEYIHINKLYLKLIGLWPAEKNDAAWTIYINKIRVFVLISLLWTLLVLPMLLDIYIVWGNSFAIFQNACMSIHTLSVCLKFTHVAVNQTVFKELLQTMKNNFDNSLENLEEKEILLKHARFGRLVTKIFLFSIYYIEIIMVIIPMVLGRHSDPARLNRYPLCAWYYWDQDSNIFYVFAYILQVILAQGVIVSYIVGMDSFVFVLMWHTCAQLVILQLHLQKLGNSKNARQKTIKQLVEHHNYQIRNVQNLNKLFSTLCFCQVGTSFVAICFAGYQLIVTLNDTPINLYYLFSYSGLVVGNFMQILLFCWPGQELMDQALEVGMAAYQSLWTNLPVKLSKNMSLLILRTQRPVTISAGGVYDMKLQNFTSIVKTNLSFLSVLRAMNNNLAKN